MQLQRIRNNNINVNFAYLLQPTRDENVFTFIADADSLDPLAEIDLNHDGVIDDNDALAAPGDEYEVSQIPALKHTALKYPTTDEELEQDQWGFSLSAYAPIQNRGETIAVLGIDVDVSDFQEVVSATFLPFSLFVIFLLLILSILTVFLVRTWNQRVKIVEDIDRQKDELLGIVSHQLAKPITAIKWNLESLLDGDTGALNKEQKESATTMQTMATDLSDLTSMILDVSRVQLGRMNLQPQPLDLNSFFEEILAIIHPTIVEKGINFVKNIHPAKLPTVLLDKRYTRMTVENLLTNAVKYTPEKGTVKLDITIDKGNMHFRVSDTGIGIPKGEQQKIFGKMYRASNAQNTYEGNGFGLYVAKGAVEGQGGKIGFTSQEGKGTTFWFDLPMKV
ncbi:MAG: HAMP domain-containing sensor histidine kinase [Candidatus Peribacteraceae bacterium]